MDGLFSLTFLGSVADLGILAASILLALFSALALARQVVSAIFVRD